MPHWKRILVPVDFSPCSRLALEKAMTLAGVTQGTLDVLHVFTRTVPIEGIEGTAELGSYAWSRHRAGEVFREWLNGIPGAGMLPHRMVDGDPSSTIVAMARRERYDVIVMGTHGRTGAVKEMLGSVAERVVRDSPVPVLTVRGEHPEDRFVHAFP